MNKWSYIAGFVPALLSLQLLSADTVTLYSGGSLKGKLIEMSDGKVTFEAPSIGTVTVPWEDVNSLQVDEFHPIELFDGRNVHATLRKDPASKKVSLEYILPPQKEVMGTIIVSSDEVKGINTEVAPLKHKWSGRIGFGGDRYIGNRNSTSLHGSLGAQLDIFHFNRLTYMLNFDANYLYGKSSGAAFLNQGMERAAFSHFFAPRWDWHISELVSFNRPEYMKLRTEFKGGVGFKFANSPRFAGRLFADIGRVDTFFTTDTQKHNGFVGFGPGINIKISPNFFTFTTDTSSVHDFSHPANYIFNTYNALYTPISAHWGFTISYQYNYTKKVPVNIPETDVKRSNSVTAFEVTYTF